MLYYQNWNTFSQYMLYYLSIYSRFTLLLEHLFKVYFTTGAFNQGILSYWSIYARYSLLLERLFKVYFTTEAFMQGIPYYWSIYSRFTLLLEHLLKVYLATGTFIVVIWNGLGIPQNLRIYIYIENAASAPYNESKQTGKGVHKEPYKQKDLYTNIIFYLR